MGPDPMDKSECAAGEGNGTAGRLSSSSSVGSSSGKSRSSGRRRRPVPDSPTRPPENAARKRRRAEVGEETTQHRVDGQEDDAAFASPAAKQARRGLYGKVRSLVGHAVGLLTPGRARLPAAPSASPAAVAAADEPLNNDEAGGDQPEKNEPDSKNEGDHSEMQLDTKPAFNPEGNGAQRDEDERPVSGGAASSSHRSSFVAADFRASRRGMSACISAPPSAQQAPPNPESFGVFSPGIPLPSVAYLKTSPVPRRESGAGDGLGFASLRRSTTGLEVDAPDSTPPSPRRGPLLDTSSRSTPDGNARGMAGERIDFGCGSQGIISANGCGGGGGSRSSSEQKKEEEARLSDGGGHESTNGNKSLVTPGKVQGVVRAMRLRRGLPPMAAMYLLSKIESESAASLRLEILKLKNDRPSDREENGSVGEVAMSQPAVARGGLITGSWCRVDDPEAKRAVPLVAPVARRPATPQKEGLAPSASLESSLMPPPPESSRRRATMGPSAAAAAAASAADIGGNRRMSMSSRSEAGFGPGVRKPPGRFDDGVDLLTPSRRAQIEKERVNRGKNESECTRKERSFAHGTPGGARVWKPATSSSQGTPWAGRSQPVLLPERRLSIAQESPRRGSNPVRRMSVAEESPRRTGLWGASTSGRNKQGTPAEMTRRIISVMEDMDTPKSPRLRGLTPARDARDATPVHSRIQAEDGPLPTRTLSVPHPMGKVPPPGGGHPAALTPARLPPSRWVRRIETLPERPDADGEKQTPHVAPLLTKTRDEGKSAADVAAPASAVSDSTDRGKENRSGAPRSAVDETADPEVKTDRGKGGGGKSAFGGHSPRFSTPLDATSESERGKVNGNSAKTSPAHGRGIGREQEKDTGSGVDKMAEAGHSKRGREDKREKAKRLKTLSGGRQARLSFGSGGGEEGVDSKAPLPRSLRPTETKSVASSQASTKFWTCQGCYVRNYNMSAKTCDMCGLSRDFDTSRRKNPPAFLIGGRIMHLGYHSGLAAAEAKRSVVQKPTVTAPEEASSVNNSAAMATATSATAPSPAPASFPTTVSAKPTAKHSVTFRLPESNASRDEVSAPVPGPAPSVAQVDASKSVPAFVPQLPANTPSEMPAPVPAGPGFVFGGGKKDTAAPAATVPSTTPGTTPTATLPQTVPGDASTSKSIFNTSAISTGASKAEATSAGAPTLSAPAAVTNPPSAAPSAKFVFGKADAHVLSTNTSSSRSMFMFGKSSIPAAVPTVGTTVQPSFGAFAPAVAGGTSTLGATPASAPPAAVSVEGAGVAQTAATSLKPLAPPAVIPVPQPIPGVSSNAFGGVGLGASSSSSRFSFSSGFGGASSGSNKRASSPAIIGFNIPDGQGPNKRGTGSASAFGGVGFGGAQAAASSMATGASVATAPGPGLGFGNPQQPGWKMPAPAPVPPFNSQSVTPGSIATPAPAIGGIPPQVPPMQIGAASPAMPNAVGATSLFNMGAGQKSSRRTVRARRSRQR